MGQESQNQVGKLIQRRRQRAGMSQTKLGNLMGRDQSFVSRIERGAQMLTPDEANALVDLLPLTMVELLEAMGYRIPSGLSQLNWLRADLREGLAQVSDLERLILEELIGGILRNRDGWRLPGEPEARPPDPPTIRSQRPSDRFGER